MNLVYKKDHSLLRGLFPSGIYAIHNAKTGDAYIGLSDTPPLRLADHYSSLVFGRSCNKNMQSAWDEDDRVFEWFFVAFYDGENAMPGVVKEAYDLYDLERKYIERYGTYNIAGVGENDDKEAKRERVKMEKHLWIPVHRNIVRGIAFRDLTLVARKE